VNCCQNLLTLNGADHKEDEDKTWVEKAITDASLPFIIFLMIKKLNRDKFHSIFYTILWNKLEITLLRKE
jgi:hypothetical protein